MTKVFLSYSHVDSDLADKICAILEASRIPYFRDVKIDLGRDIEQEVRSALLNCIVIVVVISPASLKSAWVPFELGHGRALKKRIIPFVVHKSLELPTYLSRLNVAFDMKRLEQYFEKFLGENVVATGNLLQETIRGVSDAFTGDDAGTLLGKWIGVGKQTRGPDGHPLEFAIEACFDSHETEITGTMRIAFEFRGVCVAQQFSLRGGVVRGRFGWVNYLADESEKLQFGTILIDFANSPDRLVVEYTGYGAYTEGIVSGFCTLRREQ